ncbi:MAG TPA: dihydropteroate synthase [Opitutaceae bacterium]
MTKVMGILNVTPDSFFDGGWWSTPESAQWQAKRLQDEGADLLDVGGQSTRPGFDEISAEEESSRVVPVLRALAPHVRVPISIDTYKPAVARAALEAGASWLNDIHGFQGDPDMARVAAERDCETVVMHHDRGFIAAPGDTMDKMKRFFERTLVIAAAAGVKLERLVLDPGIGFHKTPSHSLEVLRRIPELRIFGRPLLIGVSRKSVIGHVLGETAPGRLEGTLACTALAVQQGVEYVRVHDVQSNVRVVRMTEAILKSA